MANSGSTPVSVHATDASAAPGVASLWSALIKARLSALVLVTGAVGFVVAPWSKAAGFPWERFGWTCLGTALAAASAAMLNQLLEIRRDSQMKRTAGRPLPSGHVRPVTVFMVGVITAYAGCAILAGQVNLLSAGLALANILIYVLLYTPLKAMTTFNTLVGAVTGAIPPMIGWAGAVDSLGPGAWTLFAIMFVWQIPHFMALAWMYRDDYARGGFVMLPSQDAQGQVTAQTCVLSSLMLVPVGLLATLTGISGYVYAAGALALGLGMCWFSWSFLSHRTDRAARRLFLASLAYLPLLLLLMVADKGSVVPKDLRENHVRSIQLPEPTPAPVSAP